MAYIQTKNRHGEKGKNIFFAKVAKMFEFTREILNLNDVFKNSSRCCSLLRLLVFLVSPKAGTVLVKRIHHLMQEG